jgi:hypothetical protein
MYVPRGSACAPIAFVMLLFTSVISTGVADAEPEPPFVTATCGFVTRRTARLPVLIIVLPNTVVVLWITTFPVAVRVPVDIIFPVKVE